MNWDDPRPKRRFNKVRKIRSKFSPFTSKGLKDKESGISVLMTIRNEPWIQPSIKSVSHIADEIVLVDGSTEKLNIEKLRDKVNIEIIYDHTEPSILEQSRKSVKKSNYRWLFRWDGDFIGYKSKLKNLREYLDLKVNEYIAVWLNVVDLKNFFITSSTQSSLCHTEPYLCSYSKDLKNEGRFLRKLYTLKRKYKPRLIQHPHPLYYKYEYRQKPLAIHLRKVKPSFRVKEKRYQPQWASLSEKKRKKYGESLKKYSEQRDVKGILDKIYDESIERYKKEYGYPQELKNHLHKLGIDKIKNTGKFKEKIDSYISEGEWIL